MTELKRVQLADCEVVYSTSAGWTPELLAQEEIVIEQRRQLAEYNKTFPYCSFCYRPKVDGRCVTKGCPRSDVPHPKCGLGGMPEAREVGRGRHGQEAELKCVGCGGLTRRRAPIEIAGEVADYDTVPLTFMAWCDGCERARNITQAQAVAANENVFPHIRERMLAWLKEAGCGSA